eukprot:TRINITY_DN51169_c0_g1_i1.p1 TRINITY_DN51169_c0_g1~~TRINITY_DN51169_c0_g1_i1.p1  ORF type:complete len:207 (+),score=27.45 TRINITY_DN51169_c0_g1_i1:96-716(+)
MSIVGGHPFALWKACELHGVRSMQPHLFLVFIRRLGLRVSDREFKAILKALEVDWNGEVVISKFCKWLAESAKRSPLVVGSMPVDAQESTLQSTSNSCAAFPDQKSTPRSSSGRIDGSMSSVVLSCPCYAADNHFNPPSHIANKKVHLSSRVESFSGSQWELNEIEDDKSTIPCSSTKREQERVATIADLKASYEILREKMDRRQC